MKTMAVITHLRRAVFNSRIFLALVILVSFVGIFEFFKSGRYDADSVMSFVKFVFVVPLGLGSIAAMMALAPPLQNRVLPWFTRYVNIAVLANISMMVFSSDLTTYRSYVGRFVCIVLVLWLIKNMRQMNWQTVSFDRGVFLFKASPANWVLCHACYRMVLLSQPNFDNWYMLLDPISLLVTFALYRYQKCRHPWYYYFGLADTLVVSGLLLVSRFSPHSDWTLPWAQGLWDVVLIPIQVVVLSIALKSLAEKTRSQVTG